MFGNWLIERKLFYFISLIPKKWRIASVILHKFFSSRTRKILLFCCCVYSCLLVAPFSRHLCLSAHILNGWRFAKHCLELAEHLLLIYEPSLHIKKRKDPFLILSTIVDTTQYLQLLFTEYLRLNLSMYRTVRIGWKSVIRSLYI